VVFLSGFPRFTLSPKIKINFFGFVSCFPLVQSAPTRLKTKSQKAKEPKRRKTTTKKSSWGAYLPPNPPKFISRSCLERTRTLRRLARPQFLRRLPRLPPLARIKASRVTCLRRRSRPSSFLKTLIQSRRLSPLPCRFLV
jgi:hypothetical protein